MLGWATKTNYYNILEIYYMTITTNSVFKNTKSELVNGDYVTSDELRAIIKSINTEDGENGLKEFENSVTIMSDTGNHSALLDYMEELSEEHLEG